MKPYCAVVGLAVAAACGGDNNGPPDDIVVDCSNPAAVSLAPGEFAVLDVAEVGGCVRFPAASSEGAEYLYVALAAEGGETALGVSAPFALEGGVPASPLTVDAVRERSLLEHRRAGPAESFHMMLRAQERVVARAVATTGSAPATARAASDPPIVGHQRDFWVCGNANCTSFVSVPATARFVGDKSAIYLDDEVPTQGFTDIDIATVGELFDDYLHPIATTAFGNESDRDENGVVVVLLTDQVNALSGNCNSAGASVILGYFLPTDLAPQGTAGQFSNNGEVFYGLVPDPTSTQCDIPKTFATRLLAGTFIHELQHMINFNQHVLIRGSSEEALWLNEALSHFAEELAGRQIPNERCVNSDCLTQFVSPDLSNAHSYLESPEESFLVAPETDQSLAERGSAWLFVRWLADHFGGSDPNAAALTKALVATGERGANAVTQATGESFATLVSQWQLANYLDDLPDFTPASGRLAYTSWNFRFSFPEFGRTFPLAPDVASDGGYTGEGTLRAGSGRHVRVVQQPSAAAADMKLSGPGGQALSGAAEPRIAIARIR